MTHSDCVVKIGIALKLQYFCNMPSKIKVNGGSSDFIWQRATPTIVGWFASRTWKKYQEMLYVTANIIVEFSYRINLRFTNVATGRKIKIRRATGWRPMTMTEAAAIEITRKNRALIWNYIPHKNKNFVP